MSEMSGLEAWVRQLSPESKEKLATAVRKEAKIRLEIKTIPNTVPADWQQ